MFASCVFLHGQQGKDGKNGSSAHNVRDGLMWSTEALGRVRTTSVTAVILTQTQFTSADDAYLRSIHEVA